MTRLPIDAHLPTLLADVREAGNAVIVAEPGAGKTTRVPRALLEEGRVEGDIVVLEPRRLAARMAARRVASELGEKVGERVGYTVRFDDRTGPKTRLRFVTEGVFVRRLSEDPTLGGLGAVVFDELHERHLHTDLALAMVRARQREGAGPHLLAMSATLDAAPVAAFLDAPIREVPGRTHPVTVEHAETEDDRPLERRVGAAVRRLLKDGLDGDVLVFLPGAREIRRARDAIEGPCDAAGVDVAVLHGDLPPDAQDRAVRRGPRPKVVLSTNVAESSVTLEAVVAVVDSGLARQATFSPWTGLPSLDTVRVSQASATQRAGRAGRVRPGRCLRLYTEHDFRRRPAHETPEIARADLAELVLLLRSQGHDPTRFPFFEAPPEAALAQASELLERLGALEGGAITETGRRMLRLPTHPRLARLALAAADAEVGARGCALAALAAERDPRLGARTRFDGGGVDAAVGSSDWIARLEALEVAEAEGLGHRQLRARGLDANTVRAVRRGAEQLRRALRVGREPKASLMDEEDALLRATLRAFPDRVGKRRRPRSAQVVFAGGGAGELAETSVVREAEWMVAGEVTDARGQAGRGRVVIRAASRIEPDWLLELFEERIEDVRELRFDAKTAQVEEVSGLRWEGLVLDESVSREVAGPEVAKVLAAAALDAGLEKHFDLDALEGFRRRVEFANAHGLELGAVDDEAVRAALEDLCVGRRSFADLKGASLVDALAGRLDPSAFARLHEFAPEHVSLPGRKRVPVTYEADRDPWIESRLQDFFTLADGPRVAGGRVPLVLHLLAPNFRAVQVTTDLAGFWERHYPDLRKQLKRRYPKHSWPDDPLTAEPGFRRRKRR
ncbi:MAG TPA: ATP-dependent helicase HrpB [Polyangiaceae bacterium LLY-WYZ-15_(1-7)]|nr:ATP-dependent helicase HrpB [Polyangiaceae bacterium LLY-WYZ-15_(1-7)]HJL13024.1 ATP-dependent helicase HrpB [Polyangiaceae bacterium LLY-WYZ-15_(1-7)]HJL23408.1 ATP-dependent helicase HrpB [Polyangiaceae bacterium LLY-WYZ-15_(1-7)]